jgi:propionaldehyde dehydrogenase
MALNEEYIRRIVTDTIEQIRGASQGWPAAGTVSGEAAAPSTSKGSWMFDDANDAVAAARSAQEDFVVMSMEKRDEIIASMREAAMRHIEYLSRIAYEETGYGKIEHKIEKNKVAALKTPGTEDLETTAYTGDYGMTLVERAPFGVIASITPSTNPTSTVINNSISMIAGGNAVVFNPHPAAKRSSQEAMRIMTEAIVSVGGPVGLIATVTDPTLESGKIIMEHRDIPLLSVTGGEAVVAVAMKTGKKVIAAGPGNPPVIVDETANIPKAAKDIVDGASMDNNILCVAEKEVFALDKIFDALMDAMTGEGAFRAEGEDIRRIADTVFQIKDGRHVVKREFIGKDAGFILDASSVRYSGEPRLVIAEVDRTHPFVDVEMLMPVLACVRVHSFDEALQSAYIAEHGNKHSAMIHSTNVHNMSLAAAKMNTTIFVKNAPSYTGLGYHGQGYATLTIATPTGEGLTSARTFTRLRRCYLSGEFRIV